MQARFTLSDAAFSILTDFCSAYLKPDLDAMKYAGGLVSECGNWEGNVIFEIRGFHAKTGNPATISFDRDADFQYAEAA